MRTTARMQELGRRRKPNLSTIGLHWASLSHFVCAGVKTINEKELRQIAVRMLSRREYSRHELLLKLSAKSPNKSLLDKVSEYLIDHDLQSDERYTEIYVRSRFQKGNGPVKIAQELKAKGIDKDLIQKYMEPIESQLYVAALHSARKKLSSLSDTEDSRDTNKQKLYRYLFNKGFPSSVTKKAIDSLLGYDF